MTGSHRSAQEPEKVPLAVLGRRLRTALLLMVLGREAAAGRPHEPFPDAGNPGTCDIDGLALDHPLHLGRRARKAGPQ